MECVFLHGRSIRYQSTDFSEFLPGDGGGGRGGEGAENKGGEGCGGGMHAAGTGAEDVRERGRSGGGSDVDGGWGVGVEAAQFGKVGGDACLMQVSFAALVGLFYCCSRSLFTTDDDTCLTQVSFTALLGLSYCFDRSLLLL